MTNSPTRFEPDVGFVTGAPEMYVNTAGSYIKFEDYEQLKRQLDAVVAINENHVQTLAGIRKMDPATEGERMQQWASDALSGYTDPVETAVKNLMDENLALTAENAATKAIIDSVTNLDNEPQYHPEGMGCGLEDRGITDRYDAMQYGWEQAMERIYGEVIPCAEELRFPATDAALTRIEARGVEKLADAWDAETAKIMEGPFFYGQIERREAFSKYVRGYLVELREGRV